VLLETLPPEAEISGDEVLRRDADLNSGQVEEISHEELVRRVQQQSHGDSHAHERLRLHD